MSNNQPTFTQVSKDNRLNIFVEIPTVGKLEFYIDKKDDSYWDFNGKIKVIKYEINFINVDIACRGRNYSGMYLLYIFYPSNDNQFYKANGSDITPGFDNQLKKMFINYILPYLESINYTYVIDTLEKFNEITKLEKEEKDLRNRAHDIRAKMASIEISITETEKEVYNKFKEGAL